MPGKLAALLIVDDEPAIRTSISQALTEIGYRVRSAEDGLAALREIQTEVPDLLLSDLNMPGMSGFELLSVVRRRFPAIRTIAMSGAFSGNEVPSGVAADRFHQKGSSIAALVRIMETLSQLERPAHQPASLDASVTVTCPECLRTFPQTLGDGGSERKTGCIYCRSSIHSVAAQPAERMPPQPVQPKAPAAIPFQRSASNSRY
ncbi:MAG: response regulator [Terracidiphilus sp.]|jgi:CheY-like chemotaxis protein